MRRHDSVDVINAMGPASATVLMCHSTPAGQAVARPRARWGAAQTLTLRSTWPRSLAPDVASASQPTLVQGTTWGLVQPKGPSRTLRWSKERRA